MDTLRKFHRTMAAAFPDTRATAGDPLVMQAISRLERCERVDTSSVPIDEFPRARWPFEPASACSEFGADDPPQPRLMLLQRLTRTLRRWQISRLRP